MENGDIYFSFGMICRLEVIPEVVLIYIRRVIVDLHGIARLCVGAEGSGSTAVVTPFYSSSIYLELVFHIQHIAIAG